MARGSSSGRRWRSRIPAASGLSDAAAIALRELLAPPAERPRVRRQRPAETRRLVIVQLDGVSRARLERALGDGEMPLLGARLARGEHVLESCGGGAPASTPAFQAGLFYGATRVVPGFAWFDRALGRELRMDRAPDAALVERRLRRSGPGLLRGGTSYFSIFSGDAAEPRFCVSGLAGRRSVDALPPRWPRSPVEALAATATRSVAAARGALRLAFEAAAGLVDGVRWSAALGRVEHEPTFLLHRLLVAAGLGDLALQGILQDLARGVPIVYADLLGFDQHAHRRGPDSPTARRHLALMDLAIGAILDAADAAPELGYDVFVLSDHGHVPTRPFEALTGMPLAEFVARAERGEPLPRGPTAAPSRRGLLGVASGDPREGIATVEAGDLAHVYFLRDGGPLDLDTIRARHWRLVAALSACHGIGVLAARGGRRGLALVRGTVLDLDDPHDVERLPHPDPRLLAAALSELVATPDAGDLVVTGWRGEAREVVAYAWEFGSHGGVAPEELGRFVVHPASCRFQLDRMGGPAELRRYFERTYRAPVRDEGWAGGAGPADLGREAPPP